MNKLIRHILYACLFGVWCQSDATVLVKGNGDYNGTPATGSSAAIPPRTFKQPVLCKAFDRAHGNLYLGLNLETSTNDKKYSLSLVTRYFGTNPPIVQPIATDGQISGKAIIALAIAGNFGDDAPNIAGIPSDTTYPAATPSNPTVFISNGQGTVVGLSETLKAADPTLDEDGPDCQTAYTIAANKNFIFAAVEETATSTVNNGIATVAIDLRTLSLRQCAAVPSDSGIKAIPLDSTTPQINIGSATDTVISFSATQLYWDNPLQLLYIGMTIITGSNGGRDIIVAYVDNEGALYFNNIAPDSAFDNGLDLIVGTTQDIELFSANKIAVLHASTGPDYLIVNGGLGDALTPAILHNTIYALPLVNTPSTLSIHGTIANKSSALSNGVFITAATMPSEMPDTNSPAVLVGAGPLPALSSTPISDIDVVGDTVYVSFDGTQSTQNETGIFYSQAVFDSTGKILRWTPWSKRGLVFNAFPSGAPRGRVKFFSVDACNGKLWAVEAGESASASENVNGKVVTVTQWDRGSNENSLVQRLNDLFKCSGCYSVLDLDQSTRAFTGSINLIDRYALFGGASMVAFARVSQSVDNPATAQSVQTVISNFTDPQNFLVTKLPDKSGSITVLEYARTATNLTDLGYFFAGSEKGLFVFSDHGSGFDVNTLGSLDEAPFTTGGWQKISTIAGSVTDIKTSGRRLYVMTFETSKTAPLLSRIYGIDFLPTVATMFDPSNINLLAESNVGIFNRIYMFNSMAILPTDSEPNPANKEQLVIATSQGVFISDADQTANNGIIDATNQTGANWQLVADESTIFTDIAALDPQDDSPPSTVWPISVQNDVRCKKTLCRSSVHQLSEEGTGTSFLINGFNPSNFNSADTYNPAFLTINPITYFWSDGARRFFVVQRTQDNNSSSNIMVLPFNTTEWQVKNPQTQILGDPAILSTQNIYWIKEIGATGIIMAGANNGVIALE